ncbi:glycosyltransferase family 31 protein [Apiospora saccharicola]
MAFSIRRNNRIVPPVICFFTICLLWWFVDPTARQQLTQQQHVDTVQSPIKLVHVAEKARPDSRLTKPKPMPVAEKTRPESGPGTSANLTQDDVLLILKTGATVLWRRLPIHLSTTLAPERINPQNTVIYADIEAKIGPHRVVDVLDGLPQSVLHSSPSFEAYREARDWQANNYYLEQAGLPGDVGTGEGPPGGWRLDKYKFLPLISRAGRDWPRAKWYIYTEDDTYLFLPNVLRYLSAYDHREPHWLGGLGEMLGVTFAHGGSGFALSRGAWERSFGNRAGEDLVAKYHTFVEGSSFGDYALGKVLNDFGVHLGDPQTNDRKEGGAWGFNGLPHWRHEFTQENWCKPVLSWHHAHSRDIAMYYELEKSWNFEELAIAPSLSRRKAWWDNQSGRYHLTPQSVLTVERPEDASDGSLWTKSWKSDMDCEAACQGWRSCVQWYYYQYECKLDDRIWLGHGYPESMRYRKEKLESVSGWLADRAAAWTC